MKTGLSSAMSPGKPLLMGLTLLSSVLLPFALPNEILRYGNPILGIVCIAPLFIAVSLAPSFKFASLMGVVFGALSTGLANFWLMFFQDYTFWTFGGVVLGYILYNALLFPFLRGFARLKPRYRVFLFAMAWAFYEYLKSMGFLGYPWGLVSYPVGFILPLIQFIDVTGIWGLSFLMALVNALIAEAALMAHRAAPPWNGPKEAVDRARFAAWSSGPLVRQAAFTSFLVVIVLVYGAVRLATPIPYTDTARLLLVQQNINPWSEMGAVRESTRVNIDLSEQALARSTKLFDLIVWSEGSVPEIWVEKINGRDQFLPKNNVLIPYARATGTYTLFGGEVVVDREKEQVLNASILMAPDGTIMDTYGKMHLVPFAEAIPFFEYPIVRKFFNTVVRLWHTWSAGTRYTVFRTPLRAGGSISFGTPICFEDAFAYICRGYVIRGADVLINLTNVAWSQTVSAEIQHFQAAKFRAVENRRVLVRSTNSGVTAVVDPWGRVTASLPFFERDTIEVEFPVYKEKNLTIYSLLGDYFAWALGAALLVLLFIGKIKKERNI